jgi:hypothetical protein
MAVISGSKGANKISNSCERQDSIRCIGIDIIAVTSFTNVGVGGVEKEED